MPKRSVQKTYGNEISGTEMVAPKRRDSGECGFSIDGSNELGRGFLNKNIQKWESQVKFFFESKAERRVKQVEAVKEKIAFLVRNPLKKLNSVNCKNHQQSLKQRQSLKQLFLWRLLEVVN